MSAASEMLSIREFARRDGCNDKLVRRAIGNGKLKAEPDGKISAALVGTGWRLTNRRGAADADKARTLNVRAVDPLDEEAVSDFLTDLMRGRYADTGLAEQIKENALAAKHLLAVRKESNSLVEMAVAEQALFEVTRSIRDAWLNFPTRIGPLLAADLERGIPLIDALTAHVHQTLADLGEPDADFTGSKA